jgi:thioredoxin 1
MGLTTNVKRGANAERLLLLLHGLGADEHDLAGLLSYLDPDGRFVTVLPRAPYSAPGGLGYSWFHFGAPDITAATIASSLDAVEEAFESACDMYGMKREEAVVGGFSQGSAMTLVLGLRRAERAHPAAVLAMSGFLPEEGRWQYDWGSPDVPPVLMQHGTRDQMIPVDRARKSARTLADRGVPLVWREYPMEHQVALESVRDAKQWLDRIRAGERPGEPLPEPAPKPAEADGAVAHVGSADFDAEVLRSDLPVIVDFWAPWCQPCLQVAPAVEAIARMRKGRYKVVKLNIDEAPDVAQKYQVQSIPLVALFRNGRMERKSLGAKPRPQLEADLGMLVIP